MTQAKRALRAKSDQRQPKATSQPRVPHRIFLLSPANAGGLRAKMIMSENAKFILARRLRNDGLPLGELFSFISGLYFRGKLAYARTYASPPAGVPGIFVITAGHGLVSPDALMTHDEMLEIADVPVDEANARYRGPLERDAHELLRSAGKRCEIVLLGSIATAKYVEPLLGIFDERLVFPSAFVGRGDMSRGGLLLRSVREGAELGYEPVGSAIRHGPRPPKLPKIRYV
jgi:hypothetical protein